MNEQIKQRLVGAVVLVSLAVIFIPMLLDGGNNSSMPRFGSNIPQQPDFDFEPLEIPLQPVPVIPEERSRIIEKAEAPSSKTEQASEPPLAKPPVVTTTKPAETTASKPTVSGDKVSWVVQVGSFSQSANAIGLRDKLRENGFTAFVEKYRDNGKSSYRVRVGPELKRETAESHLQRLEQKLKLKGIIMGYP